jgi:hypothetical protein
MTQAEAMTEPNCVVNDLRRESVMLSIVVDLFIQQSPLNTTQVVKTVRHRQGASLRKTAVIN